MTKEIEKWFIDHLIKKFGYQPSNFIFEKRIGKSIIDLIIIDNCAIDFKPLAIVEFKTFHGEIDSANTQVKKYLKIIGNDNLPAFLLHGREVFVLQTYGWQKIDLINFPTIEILK